MQVELEGDREDDEGYSVIYVVMGDEISPNSP